MPQVGIILGSDSDLPKVKGCFEILDQFGIDFEILVSSAHRTPAETMKWTSEAESRGMKAIIAVAGGAAHLPGIVAAHTTLPVIGVPIQTNIAGGLDSIFSILQMPSGIPVATMPAGSAGGPNAALFAISIVALVDEVVAKKLKEYRVEMGEKVRARNSKLQDMGYNDYITMLEGK